MKHGLNHYIVKESNSYIEKNYAYLNFLSVSFIITICGKRKDLWLANLSLPLEEGYGLKVKQQHRQMNI